MPHDATAHGLLAAFLERRRRWDAAMGPFQSAQGEAQTRKSGQTAQRDAHRQAAKDCDVLAAIARDALGMGDKSLAARLRKAGLSTDLAGLYDQHRNLAYAMTHPAESMPDCTLLSGTRALRAFEKQVAAGKYEKAYATLRGEEPGFLMRVFSPERAAAKTAELAALRSYAGIHQQWRTQLKTLDKLLPAAENDTAVALYRILKSKEWKRLSADPAALPPALAADPAVVLLLKYRDADVRRLGVAERVPLIRSGILKALRAELESQYVETGKALSPQGLETLLRAVGAAHREAAAQAGHARRQTGTHTKESAIVLHQMERARDGELFTTIGGRRVDLIAALERAQQESLTHDHADRRALLEAAQKARRGWDDADLARFEDPAGARVSHDLLARTGRGLSRIFNGAARGCETAIDRTIRLFDATLRNEPVPFYA